MNASASLAESMQKLALVSLPNTWLSAGEAVDAVLIVFTMAALHPEAMHGMLERAWKVCLDPAQAQ